MKLFDCIVVIDVVKRITKFIIENITHEKYFSSPTVRIFVEDRMVIRWCRFNLNGGVAMSLSSDSSASPTPIANVLMLKFFADFAGFPTSS